MESAENREQSPQVNPSQESNDSSTLSKIETIKLLNDSIDRLESTIKDISKDTSQDLPSSDSINKVLTTTQELADSVAPPPPKPAPSPAPAAEIPPESTTPIPAPSTIEVQPTPVTQPKPQQPVVEETNKTVVKNKKRENRGLIIIGAIAFAIALIAVIWLWLPLADSTVSSISEPTVTEIVDSQSLVEPNSETVETENKVNPQQPLDILEDTELKNTELIESEEIPQEIPIPQELAAPGRVTNLKVETIEPELTFTPEQTLIANLQTKLAELVSDYDPELFDSVRVNLPTNSLIVEVTDDWYQLNESRQDKVANEILKRSRKFDFSKLELQDSTGALVARNPVVGDRAIVIPNSKNN